ncbi:hypothetical protein SS1G_09793 [Sclerotinia sclerotiorum 1980 UF-70]|uniref:Casparian strip membrane protein domain-containing protein n=1 Tax=Sclerotinia sclerotiorum (strain ATCC 18683 / 1980 / Ss-1) TaxID=665079 RepID=A7EWT4_SCLS1|nr:hypothetical protein SS1G_09793 [Sclerotinia sclerotiorum 1980 UF-70]EDN93926.1 hypothetical protein SS1G_09793 [Sclerotinia sclerotiorum 1980 UF-70]
MPGDLKHFRPPLIRPTVRKTHIRQMAHKPKIVQLKEKLVHFLVSYWPTVKSSTCTYLSKAWISSYEDDDESAPLQPKRVPTPSRIHPAQHGSTPTPSTRRISLDGYVDSDDDTYNATSDKKVETGFFGGVREPVKGRKWDHARDAEPVIVRSGVQSNAAVWRNFIKASTYGAPEGEEHTLVDHAFLNNLTPGYDRPWCGDLEKGEGDDDDNITSLIYNKKKRESFYKRVQQTILMNPYVPLIFRLIVLITSIIALSIAASVHHLSNKYSYSQSPSTTMAIVVDVIAIPYTLYMTWDEYTGKPLGLRAPKAKIRLVLLDLFFIILEASNLTLAFDAISDSNGSCKVGNTGYNGVVCHRAKTLCAIITIALIAWGMTFAVSIFRLVERVGGREEAE